MNEEGAGLIIDVGKTSVHLAEVSLDVLDAAHGSGVCSGDAAGESRGRSLRPREEANHANAPAKASEARSGRTSVEGLGAVFNRVECRNSRASENVPGLSRYDEAVLRSTGIWHPSLALRQDR